MKKQSLLILVVSTLLFLSRDIMAQQKENIIQEHHADILEWITEKNVPAVGIGLINAGKLSEYKVFGELRQSLSANDSSVFTIASITKTITTIVTLKLIESQLWELDEPLCKYWIDPDIKEDKRHQVLTTRHVLSHLSGLPNWRSDLESKKLEFLFDPGEKYFYSGEGFEYLRKALEEKFKMSIDEISDSVLFNPLKMKDTRFHWKDTMSINRFAYRHDSEGKQYQNQNCTKTSAASGLLTTIKDYATFGIYVMNQAGLSDSLYHDMITTQANIKKNYDQGLGWQIARNLPNDEYALLHEGGEWGISTIAILLPKSKNGIIVFTNSDEGDEIYSKVVKEYFDNGSEILRIMSGKSFDPESINIIEVSPDILSTYVGSYFIESFKMSINIILEDNTLKFISPYSTMDLYAESETKYFLKDDDLKIEFVKDDNSRINGFIFVYKGGEPEFIMKTE